MTLDSIFSSIPLLALCLCTILLVFAGFEAGWHLGQRRRHRHGESDAPVGAIVGATFGLLAFLLGFTFNLAATRFEQRKLLVVQEASAITTAYLRSDFLPEPQRSAIRADLRTYAAVRAQGVTWLLNPDNEQRVNELQNRIWANTVAAVTGENTFLDNLLVQAVNALYDTDASRVAAGRNQVPDSIWFALYLATFLGMMTAGYQFGLAGERRWVSVILLVLSFALVITLIADLDRPQTGFVQVSQQPLLDVIQQIQAP